MNRESKIEKYLSEHVARLQGLSYKWVSPGQAGVPDRICIFPFGIYFVEVKTVDGVLSAVQKAQIRRLRLKEANVRLVEGYEGVDEFVRELVLRKKEWDEESV